MELLEEPCEMVEIGVRHLFQTRAIPLHKCRIALLLVVLKKERIRPVLLALLLDLLLAGRKRTVRVGRRKEHLIVGHAGESIKL